MAHPELDPEIDFSDSGTPVGPDIMFLEESDEAYARVEPSSMFPKGIRRFGRVDDRRGLVRVTGEKADFWVGTFVDEAARHGVVTATHFPKASCRAATDEEAAEGLAVVSAYERIDFGDPGTRFDKPLVLILEGPHAFHQLGDIGRPGFGSQKIVVEAYKPPWLVGNFLEGFGFMSVHFPKVECREMTDKEKREHENGRTAIIPMSEVFEVRHVPTDRDVSDFIGWCVEEFGGEPS